MKPVDGYLHRRDIAFIAECTTMTRVGDSGVHVINGSLREGQPIRVVKTTLTPPVGLGSIQTMSTCELGWFKKKLTSRRRASVAASLGKGGW